MAPTGSSVWRCAAVAGPGLVLSLVLTACTSADTPQGAPTPTAESVPLGVETVSGAEHLDEPTRTEMETAIGDVLSGYVARGFLGDFPRQDFVPAFEDFTIGAAERALPDIDQLTASRVQDATAMRATRLDSELSFLVVRGEVLGATAAVDFAFEATMPDGQTRPVTLAGRFMLQQESDTWSVFGYDVALDDGAPVATQETP